MNAVVVPAYHEEDNIGPLVEELRGYFDLVIVVVDSFDDPTTEAAQQAGALVFTQGNAGGLAGATMTGWREALEQGADYIVQMDAGGSHRPVDARYLLLCIEAMSNWNKMIIGSRFGPGGVHRGNHLRAVFSELATRMCNKKGRDVFTDWTSGLRAYTADLLRWLLAKPYRAKGHGWQIEVLNYARKRTGVFETAIDYTAGRSRFNWKAAWEAFNVWRRL